MTIALITLAVVIIFMSAGCLAMIAEFISLRNYVGLMAQNYEVVEDQE